MQVEVVYADVNQQTLLSLDVSEQSTIETAIRLSGILDQFPEIDLTKNPVGVFSRKQDLSYQLQPNDRIEIYRPLICDPKEARRKRVSRT